MINLGSPDSTSIPDVKKYLDEFLMDERVIGKSYLFRWILVKLVILNIRPKKSAKAYKKIWWKEGSPLVVISERFTTKLIKKIDIPITLAMRYGSMSMEKGIQELIDKAKRDNNGSKTYYVEKVFDEIIKVPSSNSKFKKVLGEFLSESPQIAERIKSQELQDIIEIVNLYNKG